MLPAHYEALASPPAGVDEALGLLDGFDEALCHGFARLTDAHAGALAALAGAVGSTPLRERVAEAAEKIAAGSVSSEHLMALAAARAAITGAVHDALLAQFDAATSRTRAVWASSTSDSPSASENLLGAARSWLAELGVSGWRGVTNDLVAASATVVHGLLGDPSSRRLGVLLDGLAAELSACSPLATMEQLPARRWGDLWSRALLLSQHGSWGGGDVTTVSGRLLILGADVHEHETTVQVQVHGLIEGETPRLVRASLTAAKVATITGAGDWRLLTAYQAMLRALAEKRGLELSEMPVLASGDLVWQDERAQVGDVADPFTTARVLLPKATAAATPPLDRHPVRIAEPVLVEGQQIPDIDRLPATGPLTRDLVAGASACIGLMRWDAGRWVLQPLAVQATVKKKPVSVHNGDWAQGIPDPKVAKAEAASGDAVAVLRERAGRLLRK